MPPEVDFDKEFSSFTGSGAGSAITDIYKIIPSLSNGQIKILNALKYYIDKYQLSELSDFIRDFTHYMSENKNLSFMSSMNAKNLLKAYTIEDLQKGVSLSASRRRED